MAISNARDYALAQLDRLQGFHGRAENKAAYLFAIDIGMAGILAANIPLKGPWTNTIVVAVLCFAALAFSMACVLRSLFPHLRGGRAASLIYFDEIAALPVDDYVDALQRASDADLEQDALRQVWRNAEILKVKFAAVQRAFNGTLIAIPLWLVFLALRVSEGASPILKAG